jgi:hypothetical protein
MQLRMRQRRAPETVTVVQRSDSAVKRNGRMRAATPALGRGSDVG